jgi:hypothetical protein
VCVCVCVYVYVYVYEYAQESAKSIYRPGSRLLSLQSRHNMSESIVSFKPSLIIAMEYVIVQTYGFKGPSNGIKLRSF